MRRTQGEKSESAVPNDQTLFAGAKNFAEGQDLALVRAFHHRGDGRRYSAVPGVIFRMNGHDE